MSNVKRTLGIGALFLALLVPAPALAQGGADSGGSGGSAGTAACVKFGGWSNRVGYYKSWAAVWTSLNFSSSCYVTFTVTYRNNLTGTVLTGGAGQLLNSGYSGTIDADFLSHSTPYTVTLTITDGSGAVQVQQSVDVTTPDPKTTP